METTRINGQTYDSGSVTVTINGIPVIGVTSLNYSEIQDIENHYGLGRYPIARSKGKIRAKASITLLMSEVEALQNASKTRRLQDLTPFSIIVIYVNENFEVATHTLHGCQFTSNSRTVNTGAEKATAVEVTLDLIVSRISWSPLKF